MKVEIIDYRDCWQEVKNAAMNTIGIEDGKYPSPKWKREILMAEHSPIRLLWLKVRITDIPYWVANHFRTHKMGLINPTDAEDFISTQRTDRTGVDRSKLPQDAPVDYTIFMNAQAFIAVSRKRLCHQASPETREAWKQVLKAVREVEPELYSVCVPECVYRGFCPEMRCCGQAYGNAFRIRRIAYQYGQAIS